MLAQHFGFREDPFGATPDPRYLYSSRTHREALASLQYAFYSNRGFTALIAAPGMGKTTLLFELLQRLRDTARTAFLFNSQCDSKDLVHSILTEIGLTPQESLGSMLQQLNSELIETARAGRRFVVVVDEAQNLSEPALETLRLLTNFETSRTKLMQIVLSGQSQLHEILLRPGLVQLRQRISTFCHLEPFAREETVAYIGHRLTVAGYQGPTLFTAEVLSRIADVSEGIPRNINTLCFNALSLSCALKKKTVDMDVLDEVLRDLQLAPQASAAQHEEQKKSEAIEVSPEPPPSRGRDGRLSHMRALALAALLLIAAGAFWTADVFSGGYRRGEQKAPLPQPTPEVHAIAVSPADTETKAEATEVTMNHRSTRPDAIEITVDPKQTLSGISVQTLGTYDNGLLQQIQQLNPDLENPDLILPGEKILLPNRHSLRSQK